MSATSAGRAPARFDAAIVGAGGAGLFCAREAGLRGRSVVLLDHVAKPGRKILVSGGGRCNFTNLHAGPHAYVSRNPKFCVSALARFTPADFIALVEAHGIPYHEKKLGQLFCDRSARDILDMLLAECHAAGVVFRFGVRVGRVEQVAEGFRLATAQGTVEARRLVIATGGLSIAKTGATGFGYDLARRFGLKVIEPEPALVGLRWTLKDRAAWGDLPGVSVPDVTVRCGKASFREAVLLTHTGLSGPAILQISLFWRPGEPVVLDLLPGRDALAWLRERRAAKGNAGLVAVLTEVLPGRFAARFAREHLPAGPLGSLDARQLAAAAQTLSTWRIHPAATEGFEKAEVTRGGVDTAGLSSTTMEAKAVPGLHFIGEVVDVTGELGGYNFQWAWASGAAAGRSL